ncbi:DciA family protein [Rugosimonospora africana]|uniref:DciA family protein n=1 Tax=Rugosimonospora africana TaxID=556532 RepID=UPI001941B674
MYRPRCAEPGTRSARVRCTVPEERPEQTGPAAEAGSAPPGGPEADGQRLTGPELARAVLDAAKVRRDAARSSRPRRVDAQGRPLTRRLRGYSGPGPDPRDPQPFGTVLAKLVKSRGWQRPAAEATVFGDWPKVVGAEIAEHCRPTKLENGELTIEAESTAWATQLRLLSGKLLSGIAARVGHNVVTKLHIHGPAAPSWNRGARRVRGRGPRDTYG